MAVFVGRDLLGTRYFSGGMPRRVRGYLRTFGPARRHLPREYASTCGGGDKHRVEQHRARLDRTVGVVESTSRRTRTVEWFILVSVSSLSCRRGTSRSVFLFFFVLSATMFCRGRSTVF